MDVILSKQSLSDEEMVSIALDILLGGYETTSTLMGLIVYFLGHAPNAFQKLKAPLSPSTCIFRDQTYIYIILIYITIYAGRTPRNSRKQKGRGSLKLGRLQENAVYLPRT